MAYTITFDTGGGSSVAPLTEQTALPNPLPTTTKEGYTFLGWYLDSTFQTQAVAGASISSDVTLYAKWELTTYTITYNTNGGSSVSQTSDATQLPTPLPTTTKANHVFAGWYYDNLFTQKANAGDELESNVTLYAKWYTPTTWFEDVADAIREKEGSSGNIKHVDFPDRIEALPSPKEEETKTITPDFSSGDVVVTPTSGKVLSQVTINKDGNLIADNIKKDVVIYGITGTLESGGGTSVDRIGIICFNFYLSKGSSTTQTLTYDINSEMLSKTFFTDGEGNWYLPEDVSVYYRDTYKGKANTALTLFSGTGTFSGYDYRVTFKVGTTPVALLLYFYSGDDDVMFTGYNSSGYIRIYWNTGTGTVIPGPAHMEFIELSGNFFDDFPHYSSSYVDYWKKENFFEILFAGTNLKFGWSLIDPD